MSSTSLVDVARLSYFKTKQDAANDAKFVGKETGKSLIADTEITRLGGIETGAQVNVIETVKVNGVSQTATSKAVDITVPTKVSDITNDTGYQTAEDVEEKIGASISSSYKAGGSKTAAQITSALLVKANEGKVYNVSEAFTTTADFIEGAGKQHPAGTNVVVIEASVSYVATADTAAQEGKTYYADANGTALATQPDEGADISSEGYFEESPVYKFDVLAGFVDLSNYLQNSDIASNSDIDTLFNS